LATAWGRGREKGSAQVGRYFPRARCLCVCVQNRHPLRPPEQAACSRLEAGPGRQAGVQGRLHRRLCGKLPGDAISSQRQSWRRHNRASHAFRLPVLERLTILDSVLHQHAAHLHRRPPNRRALVAFLLVRAADAARAPAAPPASSTRRECRPATRTRGPRAAWHARPWGLARQEGWGGVLLTERLPRIAREGAVYRTSTKGTGSTNFN